MAYTLPPGEGWRRNDDLPVFGERVVGREYVVRPSAYAIIETERGQVAVVATTLGLFLPGGGIEENETPEEAVAREVLEECGLLIRPGVRVAEAVQLVCSPAENSCFEKPSVFFRALVEGAVTSPTEDDHRLLWISIEAAVARTAHASHAWALRSLRQGPTRG